MKKYRYRSLSSSLILVFSLSLLFMTSSISSTTSAPNSSGAKLIQCLSEEQREFLKQKISSPEQQTNFELSNELITYDFFPLKKEAVESICNSKYSKGVELLKYLIAEKQDLLIFTDENKGREAYIRAQFGEILEKSSSIFSNYLTALQSKAPYDCFNRKIPGINNYLQEYQDIRGEANSEDTLTKKETIFKIFHSLRNYPKIIKQCVDEDQAKEKALKTKLKNQRP